MNPNAFTLNDFRKAASEDRKLAMLTCYDYTSARLLSQAGVQLLLVGDSAANVILGHDSTLPVPLDFMIELTAAVKRGAPDALVFADMPFGTCLTIAEGCRNVSKMVKQSRCDCVKIEVSVGHIGLVQTLADAGVAVFAHIGLTPQSIGLLGGYRAQGKTADDALRLFDLAGDLVNAGAAGLLLEAVPPEVSSMIAQTLDVPVIGCGAGPACHAHVVVTHDLLGLTPRAPKFAPKLADAGKPVVEAATRYVRDIAAGRYPSARHAYRMEAAELKSLRRQAKELGIAL
jgi:3-methyl-2-oxobutanoate hydroxymethyltransferase